MPYRPREASLTTKLLRAVIALALVGGGGLYLARTLYPSARGAGSVSLAGTGTGANGTVTAAVLIDGWSWASVHAAHPVWYGDVAGARTAHALAPTPVTSTQVQWLAAHAPSALALVAGRMLTTAGDVQCSSAGCTTAHGTIPLSWFSDLASVPEYGAMYASWGISAAIYVAGVSLDQNQVALVVGAHGWNPLTSPLSSGQGGPGIPFVADAGNAWGHNVYLVSAGLGQFFTPNPQWSGTAPEAWGPVSVPATSTSPAVVPNSSTPLFADGLATPSVLASALPTDELTYLTSPTSGCGLALCVPVQQTALVSNVATSTQLVCQSADHATQATVVENSANWSMTYAHPTHQMALHNGNAAANSVGSTTGAWTPTFVRGPQRLRVESFALYTSASVSSGVLAPVEVAGVVYDINHTPSAQLGSPTSIPAIYPGWRAC